MDERQHLGLKNAPTPELRTTPPVPVEKPPSLPISVAMKDVVHLMMIDGNWRRVEPGSLKMIDSGPFGENEANRWVTFRSSGQRYHTSISRIVGLREEN